MDVNQNVSRTLEYAYDDYCIYRLAQALNRPKKEQETFRQRSLNYRHLFDKNTGLMRPKDSKGRFLTPFDSYRWGEHFTEGNSWQYTWFVPHDVIGLQKLMGGQAKFVEKLDSVFSQTQRYDISYYKRGIIHLIREMQTIRPLERTHAPRAIPLRILSAVEDTTPGANHHVAPLCATSRRLLWR